ncbi:MAG: HAD hydrolase-like protein, partial [Pseudomonadota bacterium]|nr:HAD hydrolase-like protein [Pseudomonadota bacterium]
EAVMIGDNLDTDIRAGQRAGLRTALILTGVSTAADAAAFSPSPTWTVRDYEELSAALFG